MANRASFLYKPPLYINGCKERLTRKIIVALNVVMRVADYMHIIKSLLAHAPIHSRRTTLSHYARSAIVI